MDPFIYEQNRARMARTGMAFGVASLISAFVFFSIPYMAIGFGAFGVLLSVLAKGHLPKMGREGKIGITTGLIGIGICIAVLASVTSALKTNPDYRKNVTELMDMFYGEEFENEYGISLDEALDEVLGK